MDQVLIDLGQIISFLKKESSLTIEQILVRAANVNSFYTYHLSPSNLELAVDIFMSRKNGGAFIILEGMLDDRMRKITEYFINVMETIIVKYPDCLSKYTSVIWDVSVSCIGSASNRVRSIAINIFIKSLNSEKCSKNVDVKPIIIVAFNQLKKQNNTSEGQYYHLLGALSEYYPEVMSNYSVQIFEKMLPMLEKQVNESNPTTSFIEGCLNGLNGLLVHFMLSKHRNYINRILLCIKETLKIPKMTGKTNISYCALSLFHKQLPLFENLVLNDYAQWHGILVKDITTEHCSDLRIKTLTRFYKLVVKHLLYNKNENSELMFQFFMKYFNDVFGKLDPLPHLVAGFGSFSPACIAYLSLEQFTSLFQQILHRCLQQSLWNNSSSNYLACITIMMSQNPKLWENTSSLVEKLIISALYYYPKSPECDDLAVAIAQSLQFISTFNAKSLDLIVYSAVVYQCSCRTLFDVVRLAELNYNGVITYKNFVPLWKELFCPVDNPSTEEFTSSSKTRFVLCLHDSFMKAVLKIIGKLNFSLKKKQNYNGEKLKYFSPEGIMEAECPSDISVFVNLVSLFEETFLYLNTRWFRKWRTTFIFTIIDFSLAFPLISGFYKLVSIGFILCSSNECDKDPFEDILNKHISIYIRKTLLAAKHFKDDLQISCLELFAATPVEIIRSHLHLVGLALKAIFNSSTPNITTARYGLIALEKWSKSMNGSGIFPIIKKLLFHFRTYLINNVVWDDDISEVQQRIFMLLAHLDMDTCDGFLSDIPETSVLYGVNKSLGVKLPFNDIQPIIFLDLFLPRLLELTANSIDHQTRIAACEFLHLIVVYIFGASSQCRINDYGALIKIITPVILRLAVDSDEVVTSIFRPLIEQMSHIFATKLYYESKMCAAFVETVMHEITETSDYGVRNVSAFCLNEFIAWSVKDLNSVEVKMCPINIVAIINIINRNLINPRIDSRFGAAIAFNNMFFYLRTDILIVDKYSLVILYNMVISLSMFDDDNDPLLIAIDNLVQLIIEYKELFNKENGGRIKPDEFDGCLLHHTVEWIFTKCCSKNKNCQVKCMSLVSTLAQELEVNYDIKSFIQNFTLRALIQLDKNDMDKPKLQNTANCPVSILKWISGFLSSLSYFYWLIKDLSVTVNILDENDCCLVDGLNVFLTIISHRDLKSVLEHFRVHSEPDDINVYTYNTLKMKSALAILDLFILIKQHNILSKLMQEGSFEEFLFYCLIEPSKLGFIYKNSEFYKSLSLKLIHYLPLLKLFCLESCWNKLTVRIESIGTQKFSCLIDKFHSIMKGTEHITFQEEIIYGMLIIIRADMLSDFFEVWQWSKIDLLCLLERSLFYDETSVATLWPDALELAKLFLQFSLLINIDDMSCMLKKICASREVNPSEIRSESSLRENGFLMLFEEEIMYFMSRSPISVMNYLLEGCTMQKMNVLINFLKYCHFTNENFSRFGSCMVMTVISEWKNLYLWAGKDSERSEKLLRIINYCVETKQPDTAVGCFSDTDIDVWLLDKIESGFRLDICLPYLKLLPFISDNSVGKVAGIIQDKYFKENWRDQYDHADLFINLCNLWEILLTVLQLTGNTSITCALIEYSCSDNDLDSVSGAVKSFLSRSQKDMAMELNEAYSLVMFNCSSTKYRLNILKYYLIPLLKFSGSANVVDFICIKLPEIQQFLKDELSDDREKVFDQLLKKIASCKVVEVTILAVGYHALVTKINNEQWKLLFSLLYDTRKLSLLFGVSEYLMLWHLFQCCAFNCLICLISNDHGCIDLYSQLVFKENLSSRAVIWENLIGGTRQYTFHGKRPVGQKIVTSVRQTNVQCDDMVSIHLEILKTQTISQSSLFLDCNRYDFLKIAEFQPVSTPEGKGIEIELEMDMVNEHECMASICAFIKHLCEPTFFSPNNQVVKMPMWMMCLYRSITANSRPQCVYIFLLKIILNCKDYFRLYAKFWLLPVMNCIINKACGETMNYFLSDIMILSWQDIAIPSEPGEKIAANFLVQYLLLLNNSYAKETGTIMLIIDIVNVWKSSVDIPLETLKTLLENNKTRWLGLHITEIFLGSNFHSIDIQNALRFFNILTDDITNYEKITSKIMGSVLGLLLVNISNGETKQTEACISKLVNNLQILIGPDTLIFLKLLTGIQKCFPSIGDRFLRPVRDILLDKANYKLYSYCLEVIEGIICLNVPEEFSEQMVEAGLLDFMNTRNEKIQYLALRVAHKLFEMTVIQDEITSQLLKILSSVKSEKEQMIIYKSLMLVYIRKYSTRSMNILFPKVRAELIMGLCNPNNAIRSEVIRFWSNIEYLPRKTTESLKFLATEMYTPSTESYFLGCLLNIFLQTINLKEKIFLQPLAMCIFKEQDVGSVPYVSLAPMFVECYSSEILRSVSLKKHDNGPFKMLKGQTSTFQSTEISDTNENIKMDVLNFGISEKMCKKIELLRSYRTGDIPDIEVHYSDLIQPLLKLSQRDPVIARVLFSSLISGICNELRKKDDDDLMFKNDFNDVIINISKSTTLFDTSLFLSLFQVAYENDFKFPSDNLIEVCKNSGLEQVGVLILEKQHENDQLSQEKPKKLQKMNIITHENIHLLELYVHLKEEDIVRGIFCDISGENKKIQAALSAELNENWFKAQNIYYELIEDSLNNFGNLFYAAYFKCVANIGDWNELNTKVLLQVGDNVEDLWNITWNKDNLLPWYFTSGLNLLLNQKNNNFYNEVMNWMDKHSGHIKHFFGEELCMLYIYNEDFLLCKCLCENLMKKLISVGHNLRILPQSSTKNLLMKFKMLLDIHTFCVMNTTDSVSKLINQWNCDMPSVNDSLLHWNLRTGYRNYFMHLIEKQVNVNSEGGDVIVNLKKFKLKMHFDLFDCAFARSNFFLARNYYVEANSLTSSSEDNAMLKLKLSQAKLLLARNENTWKDKINHLIEAQNIVNNLMAEQNVTPLLYQHAASLLYEVRLLMKSHSDKVNYDDVVKNLLEVINVKWSSTLGELLYSINKSALKLLYQSVEKGNKDIGDNYLLIAKYCIASKKTDCEGPGVNKHIIKCLLRSMSYHNIEASQLFLEILNLETLHNEDLNIFLSECSAVPEWMFLPWLPQILCGVDSVQAPAMGSVALRLSNAYPQILQIPFFMSRQNSTHSTLYTENFVYRLSKILQMDQTIATFVDATQSLCYPLVLLYNCIDKILVLNHLDILRKLNVLHDEAIHKCFRKSPVDNIRGNIFEINKPYQSRFINALDLLKLDMNSGFNELKLLAEDLKNNIATLKCETFKIKDFCPWLASLNCGKVDIGIPMQYTVYNAHLAAKPIKLINFLPTVKVINSLRHPTKVTMIGDDGNQYPWLVKFGEDLRQDQRIQQLFHIMAHTLKMKNKADILPLHTYSVIPFSCHHGFIQWVKETKTMKEFINDSLTIEELKLKSSIVEQHKKWIVGASKNLQLHTAALYANAALHYTKMQVELKFRQLSMIVPHNMLRRAIYNICNSPHLYYAFRTEFLRSHAILCSCHWILGIGDRHLGNTLVCIKSGQLVGVDFGFAFGTASRILPIPELVPFRLTPQILNLFNPLRHRGLISETMVKCLSSLNKDLILSAMKVFIQDPTLDWTYVPRNIGKVMGEVICSDWLPNFEYQIAEKKLNGANPMELMCVELKGGNFEKTVLDKFVSIVKGENNKRSALGNKLTYEEQVECLIEQACDEYILGLSRSAFEPWI